MGATWSLTSRNSLQEIYARLPLPLKSDIARINPNEKQFEVGSRILGTTSNPLSRTPLPEDQLIPRYSSLLLRGIDSLLSECRRLRPVLTKSNSRPLRSRRKSTPGNRKCNNSLPGSSSQTGKEHQTQENTRRPENLPPSTV